MSVGALASIVVPVHNGLAFVDRAIDSVLAQRYAHLECVVVDDDSNDGTGERVDERAAADERVRVLHVPRMGLASARNAGIEAARGAYLGFLDADDWLLDNKLSLQVGALEGAPEVDLVYSDYRRVNDGDGSVYAAKGGTPPRPFPDILVYRNWLAPLSTLLRRSLAERVGGFDPAFQMVEDWDYWYRCAQCGTFAYVPGVVAMYRLHGGQMHRDRERMNAFRLRFARKHFGHDRRLMRRFLSYYFLDDARYRKGESQWLACAADLARYLLAARSPGEARFVWELP